MTRAFICDGCGAAKRTDHAYDYFVIERATDLAMFGDYDLEGHYCNIGCVRKRLDDIDQAVVDKSKGEP